MAELAPDKLLEYVAPAMFRFGSNTGRLLIAIHQANVVMAGINSALVEGPAGIQDRKMQYQMSGLLSKDGPQTQVNVNIGDLESFEDNVVDITPGKQVTSEDVQSQDN